MGEPACGVSCRVWTGVGRGSASQRRVPVDPVAQTRAPVIQRGSHDQPRRVRPASRGLSAAAHLLLRNARLAFRIGYVHRGNHAFSDQLQDQLCLHYFDQFGPFFRPGFPVAHPVSAHLRFRIQVLRSGVDLINPP